LRSMIRAIGAGNAEAAGELGKLGLILPPGSPSAILSPTKLIANSISRFHTDKAARAWAKQHGFVSSISAQYDQSLDIMASTITNGKIGEAFKKIKGMADKGEIWTGNKLAEEFNRFVAADVMKQVTDLALKHGVLKDPREALSYINTFVNRTQGNYLASQRPLMFQGPVGQAMGLFQTYQFNLLQQVFRRIGEGEKKNLLLMAGLQGGIYGLNGMPAFNAINTYVIGNAGGNTAHLTGYDAVMSGAGKEAGEWLLYGGLSNGLSLFHPDLKSNIYNRGDINPRHLTLVPVDPSKIPIYQATERFFSNAFQGMNQVSMGANVWDTFLKGVENNGVSRPLAGLAQVLEAGGRDDLQVVSATNQGKMLVSHDLLSLQSLMRLGGAKPLDEAIVNDQMFRVNAW